MLQADGQTHTPIKALFFLQEDLENTVEYRSP